MEQSIYLDSISTTPVDSKVVEAMAPFWGEKFGNPSSIHSFGREALMALDEAREKIASFFGARPGEVYFTGSASEGDNWALGGIVQGVAKKFKKSFSELHLLTTLIEHKAILESAKRLENFGLQVTYLKPDKQGLISAQDVKAAIRPNTVLVSVMYVNNEVGTIQPILEIGRVIENEKKSRAQLPIYFHTDAVQAVQFLECRLDYIKVDALTFSAHKIYGPKGVGGLIVRDKIPLEPLIVGGSQENEKRAGTENVAGVVGLAKALELASDFKKSGGVEKIAALRDEFIKKIQTQIPDAILNGPKDDGRIANNINICFKDADGESLLIALDLSGVAASSGSACTAGSTDPSHVLLAMGLSEKEARASIRFGLSKQTTQDEIDAAVKILASLVKKMRR